jgi:threonine synthase
MRWRLAGVNSINWARVLAQVVYYFTAAVALGAPGRAVSFTVPTGNFGDISLGPSPAHGPADRTAGGGNQPERHPAPGAVVRRLPGRNRAPVDQPVDGHPGRSNFERALWDAYGRDGAAVAAADGRIEGRRLFHPQGARGALAAVFASGRASEDATRATIARIHGETGMLICPHTAVGVNVAEAQPPGAAPMITLATAHPAKFPDAVEAATGIHPALPPHMADLIDRPERVTPVSQRSGRHRNPDPRTDHRMTVELHRLPNGFRIAVEPCLALHIDGAGHLGHRRRPA